MRGSSLDYYLKWFKDFTVSFDQDSPSDQANIQLKIDHSLRVYEQARCICSELPLDSGLVNVISVAALLHDVGRFPQYDRYKTFYDKLSVNHGLLGYKTLKQTDCLRDLSSREQKTVLITVLKHNRAVMPIGLPRDLDTCLRVVRDADRLDIIPVVLHSLEDKKSDNPVVTLGLHDDPECYSQELFDQARSGRLVEYKKMYWVNDFVLLLCSWAYMLNYSFSQTYLLEKGYLRKLLSLLPDTPEIRDLGRRLQESLEKEEGIA